MRLSPPARRTAPSRRKPRRAAAAPRLRLRCRTCPEPAAKRRPVEHRSRRFHFRRPGANEGRFVPRERRIWVIPSRKLAISISLPLDKSIVFAPIADLAAGSRVGAQRFTGEDRLVQFGISPGASAGSSEVDISRNKAEPARRGPAATSRTAKERSPRQPAPPRPGSILARPPERAQQPLRCNRCR